MPALEVVGRRWHIAADDLPLPSLLGAVWHASWLAVIAVDLAYTARQLEEGCSYREEHIGYLSVHLGCFVIGVILHTWTFFESTRGALFDLSARRRVSPLVFAVCLVYLATIGNNAYGTQLLLSLRRGTTCVPLQGLLRLNHYTLFLCVVLFTWAALGVGCLAMMITFNPFPSYQLANDWLARVKLCRALCCCCLVELRHFKFGRGNDGQRAGESPTKVVIADIFATIFGKENMTISDYMAAFSLVGVRHRHTKLAHAYGNAPPPMWIAGCHEGRPRGVAGLGGPAERAPAVSEMNATSGGTALPAGAHAASPDATNGSATPTDVALSGAVNAGSATASIGTNLPTTTSVLCQSARSRAKAHEQDTPNSDEALLPNGTSRAIFGDCVLPSGQVPAFINPKREWDRRVAEPNASIEVLEEALHYMQFATAVYGWKMYVFLNWKQVSTCCRLCVGRGCGCCRQTTYFVRSVGPDTGPSEGCCSPAKLLEREAITQITGVPDSDILYVNYTNELGGLLPYYVAVDRKRNSLVVGIRGSMSLRDFVTDLLCEAADLELSGHASKDGQGCGRMWAHRGMLQSAKAILRDLRTQGVLDAALAAWPADEAGQQAVLGAMPSERARSLVKRLKGECADWRLVVTGHSLGAGVTGLLGLMLRDTYPNTRCWAFAPPAGLLCPQAAALSREFCVSVVHAKDMIPRLGVATMEQLVQELVTAGAHSRVSKPWIVSNLMLRRYRPRQEEVFMPFEELSKDQRDALNAYDAQMKADGVTSKFQDARSFQPPGHVLYFERRKPQASEDPRAESSCCRGRKRSKGVQAAEYSCRWIDVHDLLCGGLVVSRSMFSDHLPDSTLDAMRMALNQAREAHQRRSHDLVARAQPGSQQSAAPILLEQGQIPELHSGQAAVSAGNVQLSSASLAGKVSHVVLDISPLSTVQGAARQTTEGAEAGGGAVK